MSIYNKSDILACHYCGLDIIQHDYQVASRGRKLDAVREDGAAEKKQESVKFIEIMKRFQTGEQRRDFLFNLLWPEKFIYPRYGSRHFREVRMIEIGRASCRERV